MSIENPIGPHTYYRMKSAGRMIFVQEVRPPSGENGLGFGVRVRKDGSWIETMINGSTAIEQVFYTDEDEKTEMVLDLHYEEIVEVAR